MLTNLKMRFHTSYHSKNNLKCYYGQMCGSCYRLKTWIILRPETTDSSDLPTINAAKMCPWGMDSCFSVEVLLGVRAGVHSSTKIYMDPSNRDWIRPRHRILVSVGDRDRTVWMLPRLCKYPSITLTWTP